MPPQCEIGILFFFVGIYKFSYNLHVTGCNVKVTPLDLDAHISICEFNQPEASTQSDVQIPCSFKAVGCQETFNNQEDLNNHVLNNIQSHMSVSQ